MYVCVSGDGKDMVREKAQLLLLKMLEREVLSPQTLLDKLTPAFNHKNSRIREEVLTTLTTTINEYASRTRESLAMGRELYPFFSSVDIR